ncbi:MAG: rod shape-determining protein MreB, partial [Selenomonas artemidis]|nr:rod shape-determining protein MreB [Selenomonas artemidis]
ADYDITESMLRFFIEKVVGRSIVFRPRIMICIPSGVTMVEQRAVQEAAEQAGARHIQLIEEPLAAAMGAGLDIVEAQGSMVVDIGGGTTDIAVISLGGIVTSESLRMAGDTFDEDIIAYVKREFNLLIGERTAEEIKTRVGAAHTAARREQMDIRGRDLLSGLPKTVTISTAQASAAIETSVMRIVDCVKKVLEDTPPELAADIMDRGIVLTGGGALLYGMAELIQRETGTPTLVADDPMSCVAMGCGKALDIFDKFDGKATNTTFGRKK